MSGYCPTVRSTPLSIDHTFLILPVDSVVVNELAIAVDGMENPFRQHITPLAHRHGGVMHALLGLSACHVCTSQRITGRPMMELTLQHRVAALHDLSCVMRRESVRGLDECEEEAVLAIVLLLVLHDVS
jgi:Fungal specific transcription factor domain